MGDTSRSAVDIVGFVLKSFEVVSDIVSILGGAMTLLLNTDGADVDSAALFVSIVELSRLISAVGFSGAA